MAQTRRPCRQGFNLTGLMVLVGVAAGLLGWGGCDGPDAPPAAGVLLRVGELTVTPAQFQERRAQTQFIPLQGPGDPGAAQLPAEEVLQELVAELLIEHYARDQGVRVSDAELNQALAEIRGALPPAEFDTLIIESAQSPERYRRQLRMHLLRAKAIRRADAAQSYPQWLQDLRRRYPVSVDPVLWEAVQPMASGAPAKPAAAGPPGAGN